MAEELGDAILRLRTDDTAFDAGIDRAGVRASGLGKTLDLTSGSAVGLADKLDQAAKSGDRGAQAFLKASASIEQLAQAQTTSKNEIANAKAALDAGTISMDRYNKEVLESKAALAMFEDEHRRAQTELRNYLRTSDGVTRANGAQRQGVIQLTQQLGDMTTMYSLGMRPQQIFATQIGQTTQAIQMMGGAGGKLTTFLGGPWGIAITGAVMVLGPLIATLIDAKDAMEDVKFASDAMGNAQTILGNVMDLTTGKINTQSQALIGLARAQATVNKLQAQMRQDEAKATIDAAGEPQWYIGGGPVGLDIGRRKGIEAQIVRDIQAGKYTKVEKDGSTTFNSRAPIEQLELLLRDQKISKETFTELATAISNYGVEIGNQQWYQSVLDALDGKGLGALAKPGKSSSKTKSPSMATDAQQEAELAALNREYLQAKLDVATSAEERAELEAQLLAAERQQRLDQIDADKRLTEAQKQARKTAIERIYGPEPSKDEIVVNNDPAHVRMRREQDARATAMANDMLSRQATTLHAWAQLAMTTDERLTLERQALELQEQIQRNMLEQQIAGGQIADADKARAELASQQAAAREGLERQGAGPLEVYVNGLRADRAETGRLVEGLIVDELDYVHRTITDSIADRLGVKDPFLRGLIAMFVQQQLIQPMAEALQSMMNGMGGGGGGFFGTVLGGLGSLFGGGNGGFLSGLVSSANSWIDGGGQLNLSGASGLTVNAADNAAFAGFFAEGGTIGPGEWGFAGENGIEPVFGGTTGVSVMSNPDARRMFGAPQNNRPDTLHVTVSGARGNAEIQEMVQSGVSQGLAAYDSVVGDRVQEHLARFG